MYSNLNNNANLIPAQVSVYTTRTPQGNQGAIKNYKF